MKRITLLNHTDSIEKEFITLLDIMEYPKDSPRWEALFKFEEFLTSINPPAMSTQLAQEDDMHQYWMPFELTPKAIAQRASELLQPQYGNPDIEGAMKCLGLLKSSQDKNTPEKPVSVYVQKEPFCDTYKGDESQSLADSMREATQEELEQARKASEESGDPVFWLLYEMGLFAPIRP